MEIEEKKLEGPWPFPVIIENGKAFTPVWDGKPKGNERQPKASPTEGMPEALV